MKEEASDPFAQAGLIAAIVRLWPKVPLTSTSSIYIQVKIEPNVNKDTDS